MSDELFDFDDVESAQTASTPSPKQMTESQRQMIREACGQLGVLTAKDQFDLVEETIGIRIISVAELRQDQAQNLIYRLQSRVGSLGKKNTGNSWDDREEDTWIDKL